MRFKKAPDLNVVKPEDKERKLSEFVAGVIAELPAGGYDVCYALDRDEGVAARLRAPGAGLVLELSTNQPGLQLYTGQHLRPLHRAAQLGGGQPVGDGGQDGHDCHRDHQFNQRKATFTFVKLHQHFYISV